MVKKLLAITLSLSLLGSPGAFADAFHSPLPASSALNLSLPASLGQIADTYTSSQHAPLVILIQDLHVHYGAQKNIAGILEFLSKQLQTAAPQIGGTPEQRRPGAAVSGSVNEKNHSLPLRNAAFPEGRLSGQPTLPFVVAVEGATGPIDSSVLALFPDQKIRKTAADYLMKEGELTGAEYFAVMRGIPDLLTGVEDPSYYNLNRQLFRTTFSQRERLVSLLQGLEADIQSLKPKVLSRPVKAFERRMNAFERGGISPNAMLSWLEKEAAALGMDVGDLRRAEGERLFNGITSLAYSLKIQKAATLQEKELLEVEHDLALLQNVADLRATEQDVRSFGPRMNSFITLAHALLQANRLSDFDEQEIRQLISSSIDYYALVLTRNRPMVENTLALLSEQRQPGTAASPEKRQSGVAVKGFSNKEHHSPVLRDADSRESRLSGKPQVAVLVAGGFHTRHITQILKEKKISYVVITPTIESLGEAYHELYVKRLKGELLTVQDVLAEATAFDPAKRTLSNWLAGDGRREDKNSLHPGIYGAAVAALALIVLARSAYGAPDLAHLSQQFHSWAQLPQIEPYLNTARNLLLAAAVVGGGIVFNKSTPRPAILDPSEGDSQNQPEPVPPATGGAIGRLTDDEGLMVQEASIDLKSRPGYVVLKDSQGRRVKDKYGKTVAGLKLAGVADKDRIKALIEHIRAQSIQVDLAALERQQVADVLVFLTLMNTQNRIRLIEQNAHGIHGFSDGHQVLITPEMLKDPQAAIALFHEGGEGYFASNLSARSVISNMSLTPHEYLRGAGKTDRLKAGFMKGLQDRVFGVQRNQALSQDIRRRAPNAPQTPRSRAAADKRRIERFLDVHPRGFTTDLTFLQAVDAGKKVSAVEQKAFAREYDAANALAMLLGYASLKDLLRQTGEALSPDTAITFTPSRELINTVNEAIGGKSNFSDPGSADYESHPELHPAAQAWGEFFGYSDKTDLPKGKAFLLDYERYARHHALANPLIAAEEEFTPPLFRQLGYPPFSHVPLVEVGKTGNKDEIVKTPPLREAALVISSKLAVIFRISNGLIYVQRYTTSDSFLGAMDTEPVNLAKKLIEEGREIEGDLGFDQFFTFSEGSLVRFTNPLRKEDAVQVRILHGDTPDSFSLQVKMDSAVPKPVRVLGILEQDFTPDTVVPEFFAGPLIETTAEDLADLKAHIAEARHARQTARDNAIEAAYLKALHELSPKALVPRASLEEFHRRLGLAADFEPAAERYIQELVKDVQARAAAWDREANLLLEREAKKMGLSLQPYIREAFKEECKVYIEAPAPDSLENTVRHFVVAQKNRYDRDTQSMERAVATMMKADLVARGLPFTDVVYHQQDFEESVLARLHPGDDWSKTLKDAIHQYLDKKITPPKKKNLSVGGQLIAVPAALWDGDLKGAWLELVLAGDIAFNWAKRSPEHYSENVPAIQVLMIKLLQQYSPGAEVIVETQERGALSIQKSFNPETGRPVFHVRMNPRRSLRTLRHGAVHEMFHALEPESRGLRARAAEEVRVIRRARTFMRDYDQLMLEAVHVSHAAVAEEVRTGGTIKAADLIPSEILQRVMAALNNTKAQDEEVQRNRRAILASA